MEVNSNRPIHIVMTPVRNEAWVLRAFLSATSLWADHIIVADQMSTDGSRGIYKEYPKVIVIDNDNPEFNEADRQTMLVKKAREVAAGRDTLLWGLDADEILAANAFDTADWGKIINSKPGAVFWFHWAITSPDLKQYQVSSMSYPWCFHDDGVEPHGNYVRNMHSMRIPYPIEEHDMTYVNDFYVHHLAWVNSYRVAAKRRFYTFVDWEMNNKSAITLARNYTIIPDITPFVPLEDRMIYTKKNADFDLWSLIRTDDKDCWMDDYVVERLQRHPRKEINRLLIWDDDFLLKYGIADTRSILVKGIHGYLRKTSNDKGIFMIRLIDKLLKKVI